MKGVSYGLEHSEATQKAIVDSVAPLAAVAPQQSRGLEYDHIDVI